LIGLASLGVAMSQQADRGERAVRVFVSSTFRDMFLDREVLVKQGE
jgi:hypothetical protein